jgi:hypothetical protein
MQQQQQCTAARHNINHAHHYTSITPPLSSLTHSSPVFFLSRHLIDSLPAKKNITKQQQLAKRLKKGT